MNHFFFKLCNNNLFYNNNFKLYFFLLYADELIIRQPEDDAAVSAPVGAPVAVVAAAEALDPAADLELLARGAVLWKLRSSSSWYRRRYWLDTRLWRLCYEPSRKPIWSSADSYGMLCVDRVNYSAAPPPLPPSLLAAGWFRPFLLVRGEARSCRLG